MSQACRQCADTLVIMCWLPSHTQHTLPFLVVQAQSRVNVNLLKDEDVSAEFEEVRAALAQMIEAKRDLNAAVQIFRAFVLKFCKRQAPQEVEDDEPQEEPQDEPMFNFDD